MWRTALIVACAGCTQLFGIETIAPIAPDAATDGAGPDAGPVQIGGRVSGLAGTQLILENNGGDDIAIAADGVFVFPTSLAAPANYFVTSSTQPSRPAQSCVVTRGSGTATADVIDVDVICTTSAFTVRANAAGTASGNLVLQNNGGDDLTVPGLPDLVTFATPVVSGGPYAVTIKSNSTGAACQVLGGSGTVGVANVTVVEVNCIANKYVVSGTITGLVGTVLLHDSLTNPTGTDMLPVSQNGGFAFGNFLQQAGAGYSVAVMTQPSYPPAAQTCTVMNGAGTGNGNVTNVGVICATNALTIGANVSGLQGVLVLEDNGGDDTTVSADGAMTFATRVLSGTTYAVTVKTQPAGQTCSVQNGRGTVKNAAVTDVAITCL